MINDFKINMLDIVFMMLYDVIYHVAGNNGGKQCVCLHLYVTFVNSMTKHNACIT